ncbi:MAG: glycosyltransferase [Bacilli bacterium]
MTDLTIVTSCHNYGKYLEDWAKSIISLHTLPDAIVIVNNGSTDDTRQQAEDTGHILRGAGLPVIVDHIERTDFGSARNRAVSLSETEWVQHFDADDMVMPHMVDDFLALAPNADVVCLGYERVGNLNEGPRNRVKTYKSSQGITTLNNLTPCSGVSPFRRRFWEQSPYRTDMRGGWDTALWLGFAHLNARFVATKRPCFWYRQHGDSIFNTRRLNLKEGKRVGTKLQSLRRGDKGFSIIVPYQTDSKGLRDRNWNWLQGWYQNHFPDCEILVGEIRGVWNKGKAVNAAVSQSRGEYLIVADADCLVPVQALQTAMDLVKGGVPWVVPHTLVHRITEEATQTLITQDSSLSSFEVAPGLSKKPYQGFAGGGIFVVERAKFDFIHGFPEEFERWGAEDEAIGVIMDTLLGPHVRLETDLWHLWHHPQPRGLPSQNINRYQLLKYLVASGDEDKMYGIVSNDRRGGVRGLNGLVNEWPYPYHRPANEEAGAGTDAVSLTSSEIEKQRAELASMRSFENMRLEMVGRGIIR